MQEIKILAILSLVFIVSFVLIIIKKEAPSSPNTLNQIESGASKLN